jgi:hypothetical protein
MSLFQCGSFTSHSGINFGKKGILMTEERRGFKKKTIEKNIRAKMKSWLKTIPEELQEEVRNSYIVTGGAIASMLRGELPNDYDVYFNSGKVAKKVAEHYVSSLKDSDLVSKIGVIDEENRVKIMIKSDGISSKQSDFEDYEYFEQMPPEAMEKYFETHETNETDAKRKNYDVALITSNAISLHGNVQLIIRFVGNPEEIHKNYDFVHCTNWFMESTGLHLNQNALESILSKELNYVGSLYPICSFFRIKKFIERGWTITAGEMLKIAWDISKLNLSDIKVLQDQLVGVDQAYFNQIISLLGDNKEIDRTYLWEVINRVFDE